MGVKTIPVNDYVDTILGDKDSISTTEMKISNDFDYVMLMMVQMYYDAEKSPYRLTFHEGQAISDKYSVPNIVISRR